MQQVLCWFSFFALIACGGEADSFDAPIGEADAMTPVALEPFSLDLGPDMAGTTVFSSESKGQLIESTSADAEGLATLLGRPGGMISFLRSGDLVMSFLGIRSGEALQWKRQTRPEVSETGLTVTGEAVANAEYHWVGACGRMSRVDEEELESLVLPLSEDCLRDQTIPVMAFAADYDFPLAYARHSVETSTLATDELRLEWKTDFQEVPLSFVSPAAAQVYARTAIASDGALHYVPSQKLSSSAPALLTPPGSDILWTNLNVYGERGWQTVEGTPPNKIEDWIDLIGAAAITHDADTQPSAVWLPAGGDLLIGDYFWESSQGYHSWYFVAPPTVKEASFPSLPDSYVAPPAELPQWAVLSLRVLDYDDLEDYASAIEENRAAWMTSGEQIRGFLREGGQLRSSTFSEWTRQNQRVDVSDEQMRIQRLQDSQLRR